MQPSGNQCNACFDILMIPITITSFDAIRYIVKITSAIITVTVFAFKIVLFTIS
jgi:hypothetical protein